MVQRAIPTYEAAAYCSVPQAGHATIGTSGRQRRCGHPVSLGRRLSRMHQSGLIRERYELCSIAGVQLVESAAHMRLRGCPADDEMLRDLAVAETTGDEAHDLTLPGGELVQLVRSG